MLGRRRNRWYHRAARALKAFGAALRSYVAEPVEGAVRGHVNATELFDVVLAAMASGGLSNVLLALSEHHDRYVHGLSDAQVSIYVSLLTMAARLLQRYFHGDRMPPIKPA